MKVLRRLMVLSLLFTLGCSKLPNDSVLKNFVESPKADIFCDYPVPGANDREYFSDVFHQLFLESSSETSDSERQLIDEHNAEANRLYTHLAHVLKNETLKTITKDDVDESKLLMEFTMKDHMDDIIYIYSDGSIKTIHNHEPSYYQMENLEFIGALESVITSFQNEIITSEG